MTIMLWIKVNIWYKSIDNIEEDKKNKGQSNFCKLSLAIKNEKNKPIDLAMANNV